MSVGKHLGSSELTGIHVGLPGTEEDGRLVKCYLKAIFPLAILSVQRGCHRVVSHGLPGSDELWDFS